MTRAMPDSTPSAVPGGLPGTPPGEQAATAAAGEASDAPLPYPELEGHLGHTFRDPELLRTALRHKSYVNEKGAGLADNERLEFLGDAVLQLAVTHLLMRVGEQGGGPALGGPGAAGREPVGSGRLRVAEVKAPSEGTLSLLRSQIVSEASLARAAMRIELGRFLLLGRGEEQSGGRRKPSLLADAYEAVIGALYCDTDFPYTLATVQRLLGEHVAQVAARRSTDFKSALQELLQGQRHTRPRYEVLGSVGPEHEKVFTVAVWLGDELLGQGSGRSKREAEHQAAEAALSRLETHPDFAASVPGQLDCGHSS
ncbi:MAG: ribonuclease III [Polyangia bacterium]